MPVLHLQMSFLVLYGCSPYYCTLQIGRSIMKNILQNIERLEPIDVADSPAHNRTVVLVTNQFQCERLICSGRAVADISKTDLLVLNVQSNDYLPNPEAIQHLFNVSSQNRAVMNLMYSDNTYKTIVHYLKNNKTTNVITGMPSSPGSILHKIWNKFSHIKFFTVDQEGRLEEVVDKRFHCAEMAQTALEDPSLEAEPC